MKRDIILTDEEIKETIKQNLGNRNKNLRNTINLLLSIESNFVISIDDNWGNGKTVFVKQLIILIKYMNIDRKHDNLFSTIIPANISNIFIPIYFNAWEYDDIDNPMLSLTHCLYKYDENKFSKIENIFNNSLSQIIKNKLGVNIDNLSTSPYKIIDKKFKQVRCFNEVIDEIFAEKGSKIIFFVDELDRCRPDFAIKLLEVIKHVFYNDKIIFVFSTNIFQLSFSIKKFYGQDFDSSSYLNKFFDLTIRLNEIESKDYIKFKTINYVNILIKETIISTAQYFNLSLRECNNLLTYCDIYEKYSRENKCFFDHKVCNFNIFFIIPIIIGLKIKNLDNYHNLVYKRKYEILEHILNDITFSTIFKKHVFTDDNISKSLHFLARLLFSELSNDELKYLKSKIISAGSFDLSINSSKNLYSILSLIDNDKYY